MYKKGTGNDKQRKDAGNRTLCPYRNFSQAINLHITPMSILVVILAESSYYTKIIVEKIVEH